MQLEKKDNEEEECGWISWLQVLSFLLRLEEKQLQPEFSPVDAWLFFPLEARRSAGTSALHEEAPETALSALIRGWERGSCRAACQTVIPQAVVQGPPMETAKKRNSSTRLQDLAFESVGTRKV